jgi:hypothetical protein
MCPESHIKMVFHKATISLQFLPSYLLQNYPSNYTAKNFAPLWYKKLEAHQVIFKKAAANIYLFFS